MELEIKTTVTVIYQYIYITKYINGHKQVNLTKDLDTYRFLAKNVVKK